MTKSKNNDLWAEIPEVTELTPKDLMKEQAAYLKQKTKGLLNAEVSTSRTINGDEIITPQYMNETFTQTFSLVVPTLKYRYDLFSVSHYILGYPAEFHYDDDKKMIANTEAEFLNILKYILSSDKTSHILASLLAQARA